VPWLDSLVLRGDAPGVGDGLPSGLGLGQADGVTKRLTWFVLGLASGVSSSVWAYLRFRRAASRPAAERVASALAEGARTGVDGARRFIDDARDQIRRAEAELRPSGADDLDGGALEPERVRRESVGGGRS
jgi:hypothetical protein